jgi:hypothetical protein
MKTQVKVILDYDGTLTKEEAMIDDLARLSLDTLSQEILRIPRAQLEEEYGERRRLILSQPHEFGWEVRGLLAGYSDEGAFILNTTTLQVMLKANPLYARRVADFFRDGDYDPVTECTNYLFHHHTAELKPRFRQGAKEILNGLLRHERFIPLILTNSKGDKVQRNLQILGLNRVRILGDTRQYEMDPSWGRHFFHPEQGMIQTLEIDQHHKVDLRRPVYYRALTKEAAGADQMVVVADTLSLPGALPLVMGMRFYLLKTSYTPFWCEEFVKKHERGEVLESLSSLIERLEFDEGGKVC